MMVKSLLQVGTTLVIAALLGVRFASGVGGAALILVFSTRSPAPTPHGQLHCIFAKPQPHLDLRRLGMLSGVGHRLLRHPKEREGNFRRQMLFLAIHL